MANVHLFFRLLSSQCDTAVMRRIISTSPVLLSKRNNSSGRIFSGEFKPVDLGNQSVGNQKDFVGGITSGSEILYLNASGSDDRSFSTYAFREFHSIYSSMHPEDKFIELNLWQSDIVRYNLSHVQSKFRMLKGIGTRQDQENYKPIKVMIDQLMSCDKLVLSTPMWNFTVPYILKQYIDIVVQPGVTFKETSDGPVGLVSGKPMLLISSCGGDYSRPPMNQFDFLVPYLKCIFGLIGFTDIRHISIENTANSTREFVLYEVNRLAKKEAENF